MNVVEDRYNMVICPNCQKIFSMAYTPTRRCPFCNSPYFPCDTVAGHPYKDEQSQLDYAKAVLEEREIL